MLLMHRFTCKQVSFLFSNGFVNFLQNRQHSGSSSLGVISDALSFESWQCEKNDKYKQSCYSITAFMIFVINL